MACALYAPRSRPEPLLAMTSAGAEIDCQILQRRPDIPRDLAQVRVGGCAELRIVLFQMIQNFWIGAELSRISKMVACASRSYL